MHSHVKRVAPSCHVSTFAILLLTGANLAYSAPDLSFTPATRNFKYQVESTPPAAQSLQIENTRTIANADANTSAPGGCTLNRRALSAWSTSVPI